MMGLETQKSPEQRLAVQGDDCLGLGNDNFSELSASFSTRENRVVHVQVSISSSHCIEDLESGDKHSANGSVRNSASEVNIAIAVSEIYDLGELTQEVNHYWSVATGGSTVNVETGWRCGQLSRFQVALVIYESVGVSVNLEATKSEGRGRHGWVLNFLTRREIGTEDE